MTSASGDLNVDLSEKTLEVTSAGIFQTFRLLFCVFLSVLVFLVRRGLFSPSLHHGEVGEVGGNPHLGAG